MIATVITISLSQLSTGSGAASSAAVEDGASYNARHHETVEERQGRQSAPDKCSAARALAFYKRRYDIHVKAIGQIPKSVITKPKGCPRYLVALWQRKALAARKAYERWHHYHYAWRTWLPDKWQRIGACETGYGKRPGNWRHSNSSYEGAFGFALSSWDAFTPHAERKAGPYPRNAYLATPRQQYEVALAIYRRYGLSGWGCRGA